MCCPFLLAFVMKVRFLIGLLIAVSVTMQAENVPAVKIDMVADGYVVTKWELDGRFTVAHFETFDASRFQKNKPHGAFARYYADSTLYSRATYDHGKKNGLYQEYYPDGQLRVEMTYCQGKLDGELLNYHANGQLKRREQYKMNESQGGQCFDETGVEMVFTPWRTEPQFVGGSEALRLYLVSQMRVPKTLQHKCGTKIKFQVQRTGNIANAKVMESSGYEELDKQALKIVEGMPDWISGTIDGKPVQMNTFVALSWVPKRDGAVVRKSKKK